MDSSVSALAFTSMGNLYVGGQFTTAGGIPSIGIAQWTAAVGKAITGTGTQTFYANNLPVTVDVVTQGDLARINIQRVNTSYSGVPSTWQTGYYWSIEGLNSSGGTATGFNVNLTLPTPNFTPTASSKLCRMTGVNGSCRITSFDSSSVTRNNVIAFSDWLAASDAAPTAVTLTRFNAKFAGNKNLVRVKWETGNELNVLGFNVWRQVGKGKWKLLNKEMIAAKHVGTIEGAKYAIKDKKVKPGKTYRYKIEIVKANGESEWSEEIKVKVAEHALPPTPTLAAFAAAFEETTRQVQVKWETGNELNVVGFNVWRQVGNGKWKLHNKQMIVAKHVGSVEGARYSINHKKVKAGKTYQYKIEIVKPNGESEWSEVQKVRVK